MANKFVHLHLHTEYSLLDGLTKTKKLTSRIKEMGMDTVAITDHGTMYGAIEFYKACQKEEVKPIIGMEAYTTLVDHKIRPEKGEKFQNYHLLLLAKNMEGYKNLMKITSIAHMEGYYYRPRINNEVLAKYSKGLICTSACPAGELASHLIDDDYNGAMKTAKWFKDVFEDDYYLEIQRHKYHEHISPGMPRDIREEQEKMTKYEKKINEGVMKLSSEMGIPIVATNDAHYLNKDDADAQDALVCVATGKEVKDTKRIRFIDTPEYYVKSPEEMEELFPDAPESLANTVKVAEKCELELALGKYFFPKVEIPEGRSDTEYFVELARNALEEKIPNASKEYKDRLEYELKIICDKEYASYFLIYYDLAKWSTERKIPINVRGSVAGSLTTYVLGITIVDPIYFQVPFERFLNPYRPSAPDIDLDIADDKREEMIEYLRDRYGHDKVAQICTFGRMLARAAARDVARVMGYDYAVGDRIAKLIPPPKQGFPIDIPKALEDSSELKALYDTDSDAKRVLDLAHKVEGSARHISVHAAGVVVAPTELTDFTPLQIDTKNDSRVITQYEMWSVEDVGLVKLDILGIRNLSILRESVIRAHETEGVDIDLLKIPLDDKKTYEMLSRGETMGVFQLGGSGMTRYLVELAPEKIEDIMMMIALFRPGPMDNIDEYIARKRGERPVSYYHPKMEKFLDKSLGVLVYQDDLLYTALEVSGYNWEEVDKFRKAVGKKIPEEMAKQHVRFVEGCVEHSKMSKEEAEGLWDLFEPFQGYGFNKAHSASYGMVAYQTAYMKANYPVEYMAALMSAESGDTDKITAAISECRRMEIKILPPDINESNLGFKIVKDEESLNGKAIRFGLSAIKNVGAAAIEAILESRDEGKFISLADFFSRVEGRKVNKKVVESLTKVGALSAFGNRAAVLKVMDEVRNRVKPSAAVDGQQGLFEVDTEAEAEAATESISQVVSDLPEFSEEELESLEKELLGFSLTAKPMDEMFAPLLPYRNHQIDGLSMEIGRNEEVKVAAIITNVREIVTKKSNAEMAFMTIQDETGTLDVVVFPNLYKDVKEMIAGYPAVIVSGKLDDRNDSLSLLADSIQTEEDLKDREGKFVITIPKGASVDSLKNLKNILSEHPGGQVVALMFEGNGKDQIKVPFGVAWEADLSQKISQLFK
jgi:DNA polymerase-3 subunit alpha